MANLRAIDVDALPETFTLALSDVLVVETDIGTRGVIIQTLIDEIVVEYFASPAPTTPPPTTPPPPTFAPTTTPAPTTPAPTETTTTTPAPTTTTTTAAPTTPPPTTTTTPAPTTPPPTTQPPPAPFTFTSWSAIGIAKVAASNFIIGGYMGSSSGTVSVNASFSPAWGSGGNVQWVVNGSTDHTDIVNAGDSSYSGSVVVPSNTPVTIVFQPDGTGGDTIIITGNASSSSPMVNGSVRAWTSSSNGCMLTISNPASTSVATYRVYDTSYGEVVFSSGNTANYTTWFAGPWGLINNVGQTTQTNNGGTVQCYGDFTGSFPGPDRYTLIDAQ